MSGLDSEQLDELVRRIEDQLEEPWHKGIGRPKDLTLREAAVVACGYMRQNITQEVWAEIFDTSQPVISGVIAKFTPLIEASTEEDRPTVDEAKEAAAREQTVLVDGFLAPTWSWRDTPELWSGKHKTTGFNGQAIANLRGDLLFVSQPITGHNHDMTALAETETADIIAAAYSGIGDKGYQGSDFITPFKKPQGGELLDWQKEFNVQVNKLRAPVVTSAGCGRMTGVCGMRNVAGIRPLSSSGGSGCGWRPPGGSPAATRSARSRMTCGSRKGRCGGGAGPGRTAGTRRCGPGGRCRGSG